MPHVDEGQLHAYLDGELLALGMSADAFARHLAECDACRERLEEARRTRGRAGAILAESGPPAAEIPPFERLVGAPQTAPRRRGISPTALAWAATVVLALGLGWSARTLLTPGAGPRQSAEVAETSAAADAPIALAERAPEPRVTSVEGSPSRGNETEGPSRRSAAARAKREAPAAPSPRGSSPPAATAPGEPEDESAAEASRKAARTASGSAAPRLLSDRRSVNPEDFGGIGRSGSSAAPAIARGRVTDEAGQPIVGAIVGVATTNVRTTTGEDGRYELTIPAGRLSDSTTLSLQATRVGSAMGSATLALVPGREAEQDFLLPADVLQLEGLLMSAAEAKANAETEANDAEAPRVLAAAIRYLRGRLPASQRDRPAVVDERILVCDGDSCAADPERSYRGAEALRRVRREGGIAGDSADGTGATTIALSPPRISGTSAEVAALVDPADAAAYAVRLTLRQAGLRWRVTGEQRLGVD